ncbi:LysR family transcriptional regulator [Conexibacter sp. JD483]|uniref:LysR family transcriptional regulator n=1 Tax=unclassified Conexibacter TaxID=2627773 RepID=UPI002717DD54|nr:MULTISPECIES: LysR family transcriptional regulator [unclassified Conexibacter]MDO8187972.1 LysR family transcriptional regulator [Conexibacter sp. CPCC 205706]MDO8200159.1 LysR family transcriptional regulator [Conexibacter sp. CPCC 205762]MDR9369705.1 LysR family transcriptional regulator [Conexibacter sp. JD483]
MLDVRRLQILLAVAEHGSFSGAARALDYTQPAVSHHIARLEDEVGLALVTRAGRGVRLTEAGQALCFHARDVVARLRLAEHELADFARLRTGQLRIAAFPSATATLVPPLLAQLRADHPALAITLVEHEPPEALELLQSGEVDLVLAFAYPEAAHDADSSVELVPLLDDPLLAVVPPGHALVGRDRARLRDLARETWIAGCDRCRRHLLHACAGDGFEPEIAFATDDYVAVQSLVAAGVGVALVAELGLRAAQRPDVAVVELEDSPTRQVFAVLPRTSRRPPPLAAAVSALQAAAAALPAR